MKVLFLSAWYPYPPSNGSKLRIYNLLRGLAERHEVDLITMTDGHPGAPLPAQLGRLCRHVDVVPKPTYNPGSPRALLGLASATPRSIVDTYSPAMAEAIRQRMRVGRHDVVVASEWAAAAYSAHLKGTPAVLEDVELGAFVSAHDSARGLGRMRRELTLAKLRRYLRQQLPHFGACTVVSEAERTLVQEYVPGYEPVEVIPNCVDVAAYADVEPEPAANTLIFTGSFRYAANYDAALWFVSSMLPLVQESIPDARLLITGDHANLPVPRAGGVTLTGFVEDVRPLVAGATVSVVPIRAGGGTRLKILEAMALRTPVVSTPKGAEGIEATSGEHLLVADSPEEFAAAVVSLMRDADMRRRLADNAHRLVSERYDWAGVMPRFLNLVEGVAAC